MTAATVRLFAGPEGPTSWAQPVLRCRKCAWCRYLANDTTPQSAAALAARHAATHARPKPVPAPVPFWRLWRRS